ncbi:MAG: hypothetical protein QNJ98_09280 [Planctomycetota bacterium]|nr:hypothetical protein [Planctomycetota bacterium]
MIRRARLLLLVCLCVLGAHAPAAAEPEPAKKPPTLEETIQKGVQFLVTSQNRDGSWGSPASNLYDIYAPVPGSQQAFQVASSALALAALIEAGGTDPKVEKAIERGAAWLVKNHGVRRVSPNTLYNTWAHAYSLATFARLIAREKDPERKAKLRAEAAIDVKRLANFEFVEGGWGYYNFGVKGRDPGPGSTAFTTATGLTALHMAAEQGVKVPERLIKRGLTVIRDSRKPDNSYLYSLRFRYAPQVNVNQIKGSLARTPACLEATLRWSKDEAELKKLKPKFTIKAFEDLEKYGHFLMIARKYPRPHESWYQNSGYFVFYGYYYAALMFDDVPADKAAVYAKQIVARLAPLQEPDGSFWDYQLFQFHKYYGTGYVVMTLDRCRKAMAKKPK